MTVTNGQAIMLKRKNNFSKKKMTGEIKLKNSIIDAGLCDFQNFYNQKQFNPLFAYF